MNKAALFEIVHSKIGGTKIQAEETVELIFQTIKDEVKKGNKVSIGGFGIFRSHQRNARTARNPKTGEAVKVAAKKVVKFKVANAFADAIK